MPNYQLNSKHEKKIIIILTIVMLVFVILIITRYTFGARVLSKSQAYLDALRNIYSQSEQTLLEPVLKITDPRFGNQDASNLVIMFSGFQCPYCAQSFVDLNTLAKKYPQSVFVIWKDAINIDHPQSRPAAIAARCAGLQGKFWEYADSLFKNQTGLNKSLYLSLATNHSLDTGVFNQCLNSQEALAIVEDSNQEAQALGVDSTPYLFINNQRYSGEVTFDFLEKIIQ